MRVKLTIAMTMCVGLLLMAACRDSYIDDLEPRRNGAPGPALKNVHSKEFRVSAADYFGALNEFYSFAHAQVFERVRFGECFAEILDIRFNEAELPCIGMYAAKGGPTKAHMTFTILAKSFNRLDHNDFLTCRIDIYIKDGYQPATTIAPAFQSSVDGKLYELDSKVGAGFEGKQ